ncbi:MAG: hypothetical protein EA403_15645 [Spirochaetaceae bacterium]|nr:MAG: hypothetical protein EA403_15645 [Spirochaetaceae bacterium]
MQTVPVAQLCSWECGPTPFAGDPAPHDDLIRGGFLPPLPVEQGASGPIILWGWAIARRAAELDVSELRVRPAPAEPRAALSLCLHLEGRAGRYSWEERDELARSAERRGVTIDAGLSLLIAGDAGLSETLGHYRALAPERRRAVSDGTIDLRTATRLGTLPDEALKPLCAARLSFSARRQILLLVAEVVARDALSADAARALADAVVAADDPLAAARAARMPRLQAMERRVSEIEALLRVDGSFRLSAPPGFEGESFEFAARLSRPRDIDRAIAALTRLRDEADELFDLL